MSHIIERALVAFAHGSGAWVLYASGTALQRAIDVYGRDADEIGLLRTRKGWDSPMRGLYVWEGVPGESGVFILRDAPKPTFADGHWRRLTNQEWAAVRNGWLDLWHTEEPGAADPGFPPPQP